MHGVLHRLAEAVRRAPRARRTAIAVAHLAVGTALVVGVGSVLLWLLQRHLVGTETAAGRVTVAEVGVVIVLILVSFLLCVWLHPIVKLAGRRKRDAFWLACVVVLTLTAFLSSQKPPDATLAGEIDIVVDDAVANVEAKLAGQGPRTDVVLVLDPSDPAVRRLVRTARDKPETLMNSLPVAADRDVGFGLIVVNPARPAPGWRVLQAVTPDRSEIVSALAGLSIEAHEASAVRSYAQAIYEAAMVDSPSWVSYHDIGWRSPDDRSIVLLADRLPSRRELDWAFNRALADTDVPPDVRERARKGDVWAFPGPVSWRRVLDAFAGRGSVFGLPKGFSFSVVTTATSPRLAAWRKWTARTGGEVLVQENFDGARSALDLALLDAIGAPTRSSRHLAESFRPFLFFDSDERFGVLDVEHLLREEEPDGTPRHEVCERRWGPRRDACRPLRSALDFRPKDDYIDLDDVLTDERPIRTSGVIYYQVVPKRERLQLVYWWFHRYNESPVWSRFNCLAGLAIAEATCFDHEGDWEGVTVTLDKKTQRPKSVTYYGHGWPGYRFTWGALERFGSTTGDHPHVYVAFGSHASYPVSCDLPGLKCRQFHFEKFGQILPDGRHDGAVRWYGNERCDGCVQPLPVDSAGEPTTWNRFAGRWGASECTRIAKVCLKSEGPRSPSEQPRVLIPAPPEELDYDYLRAFAGR